MKKITAKSYSKLILFGEHSVVYNRPALAIPYPSLKVKATLEESEEKMFYLESACFKGFLHHSPQSFEGLKQLIEKTFKTLHQEMFYLRLTIESDIPLQRGLGSSAAVATAIVRAVYSFFDEPLSDQTLLKLVDFSESIYHLNPSGLDARTIVSEKVTLYQKDRGFTHLDDMKLPEGLLLVDSGVLGETSEAVKIVAQLKKNDPEVFVKMMDQLETAAIEGTHALLAQDIKRVGKAMNSAQEALNAIGVGHPELNQLSKQLFQHGARAVKISGAGLGGCLIALYDHREDVLKVQKILKQAGYDAWPIEKEWFNEQGRTRQQQYRIDQILG